jgi:hypothetical protein
MKKPSGHRRILYAYAEPILRKYGISAREYNRVDFESAYKEANAELEIAEKEFWDSIRASSQTPLSDPSGTIKE